MERESDHELLAAFAKRDEAAFRRFYARHANAVYELAFRLLHDESDAEEAMQDAFQLVARKWKTVTYLDGSARNWLLGACFNLANNRIRSARRRPAVSPLAEEQSTIPDMEAVDSQIDAAARISAIRYVVEELDPVDQKIYRSALVDGMSHVETAAALGMTPPAVRKRVQRVREILRPFLGDDDD